MENNDNNFLSLGEKRQISDGEEKSIQPVGQHSKDSKQGSQEQELGDQKLTNSDFVLPRQQNVSPGKTVALYTIITESSLLPRPIGGLYTNRVFRFPNLVRLQ